MSYDGIFPHPVPIGGTGASSFTANNLIVGNGTSAFTSIASSATGGTSNIVSRDANGNTYINNLTEGRTNQVATGTITLSASSTRVQVFVAGGGGANVVLPDATTLQSGAVFELNHNTSGTLTIQAFGPSTLFTMQPGSYARVILLTNSPAAGSWDWHFLIPANGSYSTSGLSVIGTITGSTSVSSPKHLVTGSSTGTITVQGQAAAGTYNFNLPTTAGTSGQPLLSGGGSATAMTFGTLGIGAGGTNATSFATSSGIAKYDGTSLVTSTATIDSSNYYTNSSQPLCAAYATTAQNNVTGNSAVYTVVFDTASVNNSSSLNTTTGVFTAPKTGNYLVNATVGFSGLTASNTGSNLEFVSTAKTYISNQLNIGAVRDVNNNASLSATKILPMTLNDTLKINVIITGGGGANVSIHVDATTPLTWFDVVLLS